MVTTGTGGPVRTWRDGPIRIIRIDRPHVRNAVDRQTALALGAAWELFEREEDARVGVLTGGDAVFSAGADLTDLEGLAPASKERTALSASPAAW
jgi:enoyl-CoA hydratase